MQRLRSVSEWLNQYNLKAALVAGLTLFTITYVAEAMLYYLDIAAAKTIVDDAAIGKPETRRRDVARH